MNEERKQLIRDFIRSAYLLPEYIHLYDKAFEVMAMSENKRIKLGKDWEKAEKYVQTDEFIDRLEATFHSLSVADLKNLIEFHQSDSMRKFRAAREVKEFGMDLHDALFKEFVE